MGAIVDRSKEHLDRRQGHHFRCGSCCFKAARTCRRRTRARQADYYALRASKAVLARDAAWRDS